MTRDDDELVAAAYKRRGAFGAIQQAAEVLLADIYRFDEMCRECRPQAGDEAIDSEWFDETSFRMRFGTLIGAIVAGSLRLNALLDKHVASWQKLLECNPYPATIGNEHGSCYAETVLSMGESRIFRLRLSIGKRRHVWRRQLSEDVWWPAIESILIDGSDRLPFDRKLARLHLAKECQRASGKLTTPSNKTRGRVKDPEVAKRRKRVSDLTSQGLTRGAIAERLNISIDIVDADKRRLLEKTDKMNSVGRLRQKKIREL